MGRARPLVAVNVRGAEVVASGVSRVIANLLEQLASDRWDWDLVLYTQRALDEGGRLGSVIRYANGARNVRVRVLGGGTVGFELWRIQRALAKDRPDVMINPTPESLVGGRIPTIVFAHDTLPEIISDKMPLRLVCWRALGMYKRSLRRAVRVICPSENTKDDIIRFYSLEDCRIVVVPYAVDQGITRIEMGRARERVRQRFEIRGRYMFMVNTAYFESFVQAYAAYLEVAGATACRLVVLGRPQPFARYEALLARLGASGHVDWLEGVSDEELSNLYSGAVAFVCPSYYEGFGFAPLEAMTCGTPTVAYATSSLPEVVGEGGILVPPDDTNAMVEVLVSLCSEENGTMRACWSERALARAALFSWDTAGKSIGNIVLAALGASESGRWPA